MDEEEMRKRSAEKVKQVLGLMRALHLRYEIKEHVTEEGFIEKTLFWIDEETYPSVIRPKEDTINDNSKKNDQENNDVPPVPEQEETAVSV